MIKKHYSGNERRALNIIWNAAGNYEIESPFLAFYPNGKPDDYFNMVIGLAAKWLDLDSIEDFFDSYGSTGRADEWDAILWLGIENCVYGKEIAERPMLKKLREDRAAAFYEYQQTLSRQQMMLQSMTVYDQEDARFAYVLGRRPLPLTPREKKLAADLMFAAGYDTAGCIAAMKDILKRYFRYGGNRGGDTGNRLAAGGSWKEFYRKFLRHETRVTDMLMLRSGTGRGDEKGAVLLAHNAGELHNSRDAEKDRQYILDCFGPCIYSGHEMRILENELCSGCDEYARLWVARDGNKRDVPADTAGKQLVMDRNRQQQRNLRYYNDHIYVVKESIRKLTAETDTIFSSYLRSDPERSRAGKLDAARTYRLPVLHDPYVFTAEGNNAEYDITVDLLLDASQSRMNIQELIASEAYIIAKGFGAAHIPVRVLSFRSLRGYTVLTVLKDYGDTECSSVFWYYAGGWNRDGLCLRTVDHLLEDEKKNSSAKRILLVLTDASPNDSTPMPPAAGGLMKREYEGAAAVTDTAAAVKKLRGNDIRTAAIFYGSTMNIGNLHQIYGSEYVRIVNMRQLPDAVSELLVRDLSELQAEKDRRTQ
jgi:hypothetical protein